MKSTSNKSPTAMADILMIDRIVWEEYFSVSGGKQKIYAFSCYPKWFLFPAKMDFTPETLTGRASSSTLMIDAGSSWLTHTDAFKGWAIHHCYSNDKYLCANNK